MNTALSWIKAYVPDLSCTDQEYFDAMTLTGTKVEGYERMDKNLEKIVIGQIEKIEKHPDADKLIICQVNVGDRTIQIVTGAPNVKEGDKVPVVLDGGKVAGGYDGNVYNINADIAASQIAAKIGAKKLILMTDIRGLLRDVHDEDSLIPVVNVSEVPMLKRDGIISGGMIPKIDCCVEAVRSGVNRAHIIDGRIEHSILLELFSDEGIGTMFY